MFSIPRFLKPKQAARKLGVTLEELEELNIKKVAKLGPHYYEIRDINRYMAKQREEVTKFLSTPKKSGSGLPERQSTNLRQMLLAKPASSGDT